MWRHPVRGLWRPAWATERAGLVRFNDVVGFGVSLRLRPRRSAGRMGVRALARTPPRRRAAAVHGRLVLSSCRFITMMQENGDLLPRGVAETTHAPANATLGSEKPIQHTRPALGDRSKRLIAHLAAVTVGVRMPVCNFSSPLAWLEFRSPRSARFGDAALNGAPGERALAALGHRLELHRPHYTFAKPGVCSAGRSIRVRHKLRRPLASPKLPHLGYCSTEERDLNHANGGDT